MASLREQARSPVQGSVQSYQLSFTGSFTEYSSLVLLPPPPGVERQTAEEKAFGDFIINGPDTAYGMMDFTYEPKEFDRLVTLSRYNVLNNMETIRHALQLALDRRRQAGGRVGG